MSVRALTASLIVLLSSSLRAEPAQRKPWHADVQAPRAGLPSVTVDFGYPGPYVPMLNAPIALRATATDIPFDGYIGYHFAAHGLMTLDTPVIARATLRPHQSWSFSTTATVRRCCIQNFRVPREVTIEWRDRTRELIASQSAGTPPWTTFEEDRMPLLIDGEPLTRRFAPPSPRFAGRGISSENPSPRLRGEGARRADEGNVLGRKAYVERAEALPDQAQWYAGFSDVVCPLATWLDLPQKTRDAIFGSGVHVVFVGFPRPGQQLGRLEQTLLPVAFRAQPGSYDAPWPYRGSRKLPAATPYSWTVKAGADKLGSDQNPYLARTYAASWVADAVAIAYPLPAIARVATRPRRLSNFDEVAIERSDRASALSVYASTIATAVAIVIAIAAWILLRKTPRAAIIAAIVLTATVVFAQRGRIRPSSAMRDHVIRAPIAAGIVDTFHVWHTYGSVPIAAAQSSPRTSITADYGSQEAAEVRTSSTAPSMGELQHNGDWDSVVRWTYQRELDSSATPPATIVLPSIYDYHSPIFLAQRYRTDGTGETEIVGENASQPDGRRACVIGLPSDVQSAVLSVPFTASNALLTWATGSTTLTLTRKDMYSSRVAQIPSDVLRQIVEQGGIVKVTFDRPLEREFGKVSIRMREKS